MPYGTNDDLPPAIKEHLPAHAQDIFREAFNNAWQEYGDEESAFRVAWAAVRRRYQKAGEIWVEK